MRINRQELLQRLEAVSAGLAAKETVEQSSCFIFRNGLIQTYNGEVACTQEYPHCTLEGAVASAPLLALLPKLSEEDIDIEMGKVELLIKGLGRRSGIRMEQTITLPVETVEVPAEWHPVPEDFATAIAFAVECTVRDDKAGFHLTCVHLDVDKVEACDNWQMTRFPLALPIAGSTLLKRDYIKHVAALDMTEIAETRAWLHFRSPSGLQFSIRKFYDDNYPNLDQFMDFTGVAASLPGGLADALDKTAIFSSENKDSDNITVEIRNDNFRVTGRSSSGWHSEIKKAKYAGEPIAFMISPTILTEICKKHNDVEIAPGRMKVSGARFTYVTSLGTIDA